MKKLTMLLLSVLSIILLAQTVRAEVYKKGSVGYKVIEIQTRLKTEGFYGGAIDGVFGPKTLLAVENFQKKSNLAIDGIVGPQTLSALGIKPDVFTEDDIWLLTRIINGEGRGESYLGKVAIGAVVMNRVKHPYFPNTIREVIFEQGAFAAVSDGQFYLTPYDSCRQAAIDALNGLDPTGGAIFYWNPNISKSTWVLTLTVLKDIGNHRFAKD